MNDGMGNSVHLPICIRQKKLSLRRRLLLRRRLVLVPLLAFAASLPVVGLLGPLPLLPLDLELMIIQLMRL